MRGPLYVLSILTVIFAFLSVYAGGASLFLEGISTALWTLLETTPLILVAFFVVGQMEEAINAEKMNAMLDKHDGFRAVVIVALLGGAFPGPPYTYYPFLARLSDKRMPVYLYFTFLAGKQTYDVTRLPMEVSLIFPHIALIRNLITLPMPIFMAFIYRVVFGRKDTVEFFKGFIGGGDA